MCISFHQCRSVNFASFNESLVNIFVRWVVRRQPSSRSYATVLLTTQSVHQSLASYGLPTHSFCVFISCLVSAASDSMCMTHRWTFLIPRIRARQLKKNGISMLFEKVNGRRSSSSLRRSLQLVCANMPIPYNAYLHFAVLFYPSIGYSCTFYMLKLTGAHSTHSILYIPASLVSVRTSERIK